LKIKSRLRAHGQSDALDSSMAKGGLAWLKIDKGQESKSGGLFRSVPRRSLKTILAALLGMERNVCLLDTDCAAATVFAATAGVILPRKVQTAPLRVLLRPDK
jgi:hypothetical protein